MDGWRLKGRGLGCWATGEGRWGGVRRVSNASVSSRSLLFISSSCFILDYFSSCFCLSLLACLPLTRLMICTKDQPRSSMRDGRRRGVALVRLTFTYMFFGNPAGVPSTRYRYHQIRPVEVASGELSEKRIKTSTLRSFSELLLRRRRWELRDLQRY